MKSFLALVAAEPVRCVAAIQTTLAAAVVFGVDISQDQLAVLVLAIAAWLGLITRQQVTPV